MCKQKRQSGLLITSAKGFKQQVSRLNSSLALEPVRSQAGLQMIDEPACGCCLTHYRKLTCCSYNACSQPSLWLHRWHSLWTHTVASNICRHLNAYNVDKLLLDDFYGYDHGNLKAVLHKINSDAGRRPASLVYVFIDEHDVRQIINATLMGNCLSSVISLSSAAASDQPYGS